ncbi:MAG: YjhG/YagF family D-xylonate dehydratase [Planctomycetaceae bacterium]|jgi:xylonate dehydratase|nr:YjhG/YagF family D-xylonate dehydratase [Planctomycetaceae bacterium]MBT6155205.1 YjhG/YagF family D-xylonate dehydratase [Planctomycetaceae bacterium]MBT6483279.1 YjhG/YagF family D-xylonate dehydratase [Planctomycetaceae bacterium]MBT6494606.1 YjhG/YagF family D-xylonate dehydratase [Planctomycetaceae bacterium]
MTNPTLDELLSGPATVFDDIHTEGVGPAGQLPITDDMLRDSPSGDLFGMTQNAGMGWNPQQLLRDQYLILSTQGGIRGESGQPIALGYHTGHWEVGLLMRAAAEELDRREKLPFAAFVSDPCDGRSQGTTAMMDSLAYRNDAAIVLGRLIRSLPTRKGVVGVATCDKGLPAMMLALAAATKLPSVIVPGGVTLPAKSAEDAGKVQSIGARFAHGEITREYAADMGCRACGTPGGGCQFLGTAATSQVVAEALGMALPHTALAPSGQPIWREIGTQAAAAVVAMQKQGTTLGDILTDDAVHNAMTVHAAVGGSTNLLLHLPAVAFAAGLKRPTVDDWNRINRQTPRLVDVLPNGPVGHPTVRLFLAGGVPEIMLNLRTLGLLQLDALTASGRSLGDVLDWWEGSDRRLRLREKLTERDGIDPDDVVMSPDRASDRGLTSTVTFPVGNIAPEGSVIKSTAIDPSVVDDDGVFRHTGPARVFTSERDAIAAIKGRTERDIEAGDVIVLICRGPLGAGMEETYQITSALRYLEFGKQVAVITDARFSGVSTGACIGHVGPEALAGGPVGKLRDGDTIEIIVDRNNLNGSINFIGEGDRRFSSADGAQILEEREQTVPLAADPDLPDDTRLWAILQQAGGGTWGGCVYDVDAIEEIINAGRAALGK